MFIFNVQSICPLIHLTFSPFKDQNIFDVMKFFYESFDMKLLKLSPLTFLFLNFNCLTFSGIESIGVETFNVQLFDVQSSGSLSTFYI
jgi:hypothetical protein